MKQFNRVEILFVATSLNDDRGRRVLVRDGGCENTIWGDELIELRDIDRRLLGLTAGQQEQIKAFLAGGGRG
jgi:hypothetical protein